MDAPKPPEPAPPEESGADPKAVDLLGKTIEAEPTKQYPAAQRTDSADFLADIDGEELHNFRVRLTPLEHLLAEVPFALGEPVAERLTATHGLAGHLGNGISWIDSLHFGGVAFGRQRFKLARNLADQRGAVVAFLIAVRDINGKLVDIVAWHPETGRVATVVGPIGALGLASTRAFRIEPPLVRETIVDWLRSDRDGVFIIDDRLAASQLDGVTIAVHDIETAKRVRARLARFGGRPNIIIPRRAA